MTVKEFKVIRVKDGSFDGSDGERVPYFWIKGETDAGLTIEFGTKDGERSAGDTLTDLQLEKSEGSKPGSFRYKEVL